MNICPCPEYVSGWCRIIKSVEIKDGMKQWNENQIEMEKK